MSKAMRVLPALALGFAWLLSAGALASDHAAAGGHGGEHAGGHGSIDWYLLGGQLFTFFMFVGILYFALKDRIPAFFLARHNDVKAAVEEAKKAKAEAEAKAREYDTKIRDLDQELTKLSQSLAAGAASERERLMQEAQLAAQRIAKDAQTAIDGEMERARATLRAEAADMAVQMARELLQREMKPDDHQRIVLDAAKSVSSRKLGATSVGGAA